MRGHCLFVFFVVSLWEGNKREVGDPVGDGGWWGGGRGPAVWGSFPPVLDGEVCMLNWSLAADRGWLRYREAIVVSCWCLTCKSCWSRTTLCRGSRCSARRKASAFSVWSDTVFFFGRGGCWRMLCNPNTVVALVCLCLTGGIKDYRCVAQRNHHWHQVN